MSKKVLIDADLIERAIASMDTFWTVERRALRAALEAPQPEPVAWLHPAGGVLQYPLTGLELATYTIPLYAATPEPADVAALRAALLDVARRVEALKRPCGMDPESAQAIRNGEYMSIALIARAAIDAAMGK